MARSRRLRRRRVVSRVGRVDAPEQGREDPIEQVKQLQELREQGILTEDEFTAEKRRILGLQ